MCQGNLWYTNDNMIHFNEELEEELNPGDPLTFCKVLTETRISCMRPIDVSLADNRVVVEQKFIKGDFFILTFGHYYHFLIEQIGHYLYLKQFKPDLKPLYIWSGSLAESYGLQKSIIDLLEIPSNHVINQYQIAVGGTLYQPKYSTYNNFYAIDDEKYVNWQQEFLKERAIHFQPTNMVGIISDYVLSKINHYDIPHKKKIFISRGYVNKKYLIDVYNSHSQENDFGKATPSALRLIPEDIENLIESKYKERGYAIVHLESMPLDEQANLFAKATHVAGFAGTNLLNVIFCKKDVAVEIIPYPRSYQFDFNQIFDGVGIKAKEYTIFDIINDLV